MSWLENHHLHLTLLFGVFIAGLAVAGLYVGWKSHNPTAVIAVIPAAITGLTGLHAGSSVVAASPSTPAYGSNNAPPVVSQPPATPPHTSNF